MKNQNTKLAAATWPRRWPRSLLLQQTQHIPVRIYLPPAMSLSQIVNIATPIPNYVRSYYRGRKNMMVIGRLRRL